MLCLGDYGLLVVVIVVGDEEELLVVKKLAVIGTHFLEMSESFEKE